MQNGFNVINRRPASTSTLRSIFAPVVVPLGVIGGFTLSASGVRPRYRGATVIGKLIELPVFVLHQLGIADLDAHGGPGMMLATLWVKMLGRSWSSSPAACPCAWPLRRSVSPHPGA